jgi:uncharacterized protein
MGMVFSGTGGEAPDLGSRTISLMDSREQEKMSKISRYNHFQNWRDGYHIAFNAFTGSLALMTDENYLTYLGLVSKMTNGGNAANLNSSEQELLKQLEYGHFMYPDQSDEFQTLKFLHGSARYDKSQLALIVAPTLACNMACPYCYESNKSGKMTSEIVNSIIDFADKRAQSLEKLDINWYGGEPLLAMDIIDDLSTRLMSLGKEKQFTYTSSIVSNGYLLNRETVDRLVELNVSVCQVTLDGPARLHNVKRPLKNGKESFRTIVDNVSYACTKMLMSVRINIDKTFDAAVIAELLAELKQAGIEKRVAVNFGQLEPSSATCAAVAEACYEVADFSQVEIGFYRQLLDEGFRIEKLPRPTAAFCMAHQLNAFLIDPEGYLYRCWNYVGDHDKSMGHIRDAVDYQNPNFTRLFAFDPFSDPLCSNCDILPICMGGCPSNRVDRGQTGEKACQSWKHNLTPMLEIIARSRQQLAKSTPKEQS